MPLLNANYGYNNELWPLLRPLPYQFRYSLYGEWHLAMSDSKDRSYIPVMGLAAAAIQNSTKQTLKRMTSELNRAHARAIGKGSYSAPTALWQAILPQIMSYENMIDTVVESARYLSSLGWDVTMFMLLDALSDESKERVKSDGLTASAWLQGMSHSRAFMLYGVDRVMSFQLYPPSSAGWPSVTMPCPSSLLCNRLAIS